MKFSADWFDLHQPWPPEAPAKFRQLGSSRGRLMTQTAVYDPTWTGSLRIYRLRRETISALAMPDWMLLCEYDLDRYPSLDPLLMSVWTPTEWLYFLESELPLDPRPAD